MQLEDDKNALGHKMIISYDIYNFSSKSESLHFG